MVAIKVNILLTLNDFISIITPILNKYKTGRKKNAFYNQIISSALLNNII